MLNVGRSRVGDPITGRLVNTPPLRVGYRPYGGGDGLRGIGGMVALGGGGLSAGASDLKVTLAGVGTISSAALEQAEAPLWVLFK